MDAHIRGVAGLEGIMRLQSMCRQYDCSLSSPYSTAPCLHEYATEQ